LNLVFSAWYSLLKNRSFWVEQEYTKSRRKKEKKKRCEFFKPRVSFITVYSQN